MWTSNYSSQVTLKGRSTVTKSQASEVMIKLFRHMNSLYKKDIGVWQAARQQALHVQSPRRLRLYEVYADVMLDTHLTGIVRKRILKVTNKPFELIDKNDERAYDLEKMLKKSWFRSFMTYAMESIFYGHSLIEFYWDIKNKKIDFCQLIPREHVSPEKGQILLQWGDYEGPSFTEGELSEWVIPIGGNEGLGLLDGISPIALIKKNAIGAWSEFLELFGIPFRSAKTNSYDVEVRNQIESMLEGMGGSAWALFPEGTDFEIHSNGQTDSYRVFDMMIERANSEMSKAILGQTMTTDDGSSKSQSEVHQLSEDEITDDDMMFIKDVINDQLMPFLISKGYPLEGVEFRWQAQENQSVSEKWAIDSGIIDRYDKVIAHPLLSQHIENTYGIEMDEPKEKEEGHEQVTQPEDSQETDPEEESDFNQGQPNEEAEMAGRIEATYRSFDVLPPQMSLSFKRLLNRVLNRVYVGDSSPSNIDPELLSYTKDTLEEALMSGLGDIVQWSDEDHRFVSELRNNVHVFSAFKNHQWHKEVGKKLLDDEGKVRSFRDFATAVEPISQKYNRTYLQAEYNTALVSAQSARRFKDFERSAGRRPYLVFNAVQDARTRNSHSTLHKIKRPIEDSFWDDYTPPLDWNCRCFQTSSNNSNGVSAPDRIEQAIKETPLKPEFRNNPGRSKKIFNDEHPYLATAAKPVTRLNVQLPLGHPEHKQQFSEWVNSYKNNFNSKGEYWEVAVMQQEYFKLLGAKKVQNRIVYLSDKKLVHTQRNAKKERQKSVDIEQLKRLPELIDNAQSVYYDEQDPAIIYINESETEGELIKTVVKADQKISKREKKIGNLTVTMGIISDRDINNARYKKLK